MSTEIFGYTNTLLLQNAEVYVLRYDRKDISPYLKYLDAMETTMRKNEKSEKALLLVKIMAAYTDYCDVV